MLFALQVPQAGGETEFANMYAACEALPERRRRSLARRTALHDTTASRLPASDMTRAARRAARAASATHPVIRRHAETDRDALYVGNHAWSFAASTSRRSRRAIAALNEFATSRDDWIYAHKWQVGDLVIWDNRCVLHRAMPYNLSDPRAMLRVVVADEALNA